MDARFVALEGIKQNHRGAQNEKSLSSGTDSLTKTNWHGSKQIIRDQAYWREGYRINNTFVKTKEFVKIGFSVSEGE